MQYNRKRSCYRELFSLLISFFVYIFSSILTCLFLTHIDTKQINKKLHKSYFFHKEKEYLKIHKPNTRFCCSHFSKWSGYTNLMTFINLFFGELFLHLIIESSLSSSHLKNTNSLDSHFSLFIETFDAYKIKYRHLLNRGNAVYSFRKSEWEGEANTLFQTIYLSLISQAINTLKGEINLNVCLILESGMKYW